MIGPFENALGGEMQDLPATVRDHLSAREGCRHYRGTMRVVWRRRGLRGLLALPFLYLAARAETLFPETGRDVAFTLQNTCVIDESGRCRMSWTREFIFPKKTRCFTAEMHFDPSRATIVDWLGRRRALEVELHPSIVDGVFHMTSGKQWLKTPLGRMPLPPIVTGRARVREEQARDGKLKIAVTISNPLLGSFFGYEGVFHREKQDQ